MIETLKLYALCIPYYDINHGEMITLHFPTLHQNKKEVEEIMAEELETLKNELLKEYELVEGNENDMDYFEDNFKFETKIVEYIWMS
jgi:hypothetical protein